MCGIDSFPSFNNIDKLHEIKINLMNNLKMQQAILQLRINIHKNRMEEQ